MFTIHPTWWLASLVVVGVAARYSLVDRPDFRFIGSVLLRGLAILLLILALGRLTWSGQVERKHLVFLVDASASVSLAGVQTALTEIEAAIDALPASDSWDLAVVADGIRRFDSVSDARETIETWQETGSADRFRAATDTTRALEWCRMRMPGDRSTRVVLYTDGKSTSSEAGEALARLQQAGATCVRRPLASLDQPEAAVVDVQATPSNAYEGELVRLRTTVLANRSGPAELTVVHRGVVSKRTEVQLVANQPQQVVVSVPMVTPGRSQWQVQLQFPDDHFAVNNTARCTIQVSGRPRILVIHEQPREMRSFERALEKQDLVIEMRPPRGLPTSMPELLAFDAVVLADAPATAFTAEDLERLRRYVRDFAGGLVMLGSENSFGLGGYYRTPVEEALPLVSRFEKEKEEPSLAMALVIDKSGSMSGMPIALARQAAKSAVELIGPRDQIGVVAFDGDAWVASPMQYGSSKAQVKDAIDQIDAGGGTFMYAGMQAAGELVTETSAQIKHMIVLGDGMTAEADHEGLVTRLREQGVTISMVALGEGADRNLMSNLAQVGQGRYYETMNPSDVPQIFTRETVQASRSAIKEDLFASVKVSDHPLLDGTSEASLPFSLGFVMTRAKPTGRVLLVTETGDPLLAVNHYGLGSTLAFTSDLTARWGAEWLAWPEFGRFWAQAFRSLIRRPDAQQARVELVAERDALVIDLWEQVDGTRPLVDWQMEVSTGAGPGAVHEVLPVGIGRFRSRVPHTGQESATIRLYDSGGSRLQILHYERSYPDEYNLAGRPDPDIEQLVEAAPTSLLAGMQPRQVQRRMAPWLIAAAACSMLAGLLLRRI